MDSSPVGSVSEVAAAAMRTPFEEGTSMLMPPTPKAKAKAKGKGKAKAKSKGRHMSGDGEDMDLSGETKKCKDCKKDVPVEYFQDKQTSCFECRNIERQIMGMADRQKCTDWVRDLRANEPKEFAKLQAAVKKSTPDLRGRRHFDIVRYRETVYAKVGIRYEGQKKMMWEGEYMEWAKSAEAGYLTKQEAANNWARWGSDPNHPSDELGSRGYKRLLVHQGDFANHFEEAGKEKAVDAFGRGRRNARRRRPRT